ncbi:hypothetical protein NC651_039385 [Populus alba x Populus x berolinensis]|nr:hypothetical protein NC651_039385 [Populus alba x Populus x berolinensis]
MEIVVLVEYGCRRYLRAFGNGVLGNLEYQYFSVGGEISLGRKVATFFGKGTLSAAAATVVWVTPMVLAAVEKVMKRERVRKKGRSSAQELARDIFLKIMKK